MATILFLAGSTRAGSLNKSLALSGYSIAERMGIDSTYVDLKKFELPVYDADLEARDGIPENAIALKEIVTNHDSLFIASPEYNGSFTPLLKNTIDWISRPNTAEEPPLSAFKNKFAAICAASPGSLGGICGLSMLRLLLSNIGVTVIGKALSISAAHHAFDDKGVIKDHSNIVAVESMVEMLQKISRKGLEQLN